MLTVFILRSLQGLNAVSLVVKVFSNYIADLCHNNSLYKLCYAVVFFRRVGLEFRTWSWRKRWEIYIWTIWIWIIVDIIIVFVSTKHLQPPATPSFPAFCVWVQFHVIDFFESVIALPRGCLHTETVFCMQFSAAGSAAASTVWGFRARGRYVSEPCAACGKTVFTGLLCHKQSVVASFLSVIRH